MRYVWVFLTLLIIAGCGSSLETEEVPEKVESTTTSDVFISFSEVNVLTTNTKLDVTGEAKTDESSFYYIIEQDGKVLVEETEVVLGESVGEWKSFELEDSILEVDQEDEAVPIIKLYVKDGDKINNPHFVPIDLINY